MPGVGVCNRGGNQHHRDCTADTQLKCSLHVPGGVSSAVDELAPYAGRRSVMILVVGLQQPDPVPELGEINHIRQLEAPGHPSRRQPDYQPRHQFNLRSGRDGQRTVRAPARTGGVGRRAPNDINTWAVTKPGHRACQNSIARPAASPTVRGGPLSPRSRTARLAGLAMAAGTSAQQRIPRLRRRRIRA